MPREAEVVDPLEKLSGEGPTSRAFVIASDPEKIVASVMSGPVPSPDRTITAVARDATSGRAQGARLLLNIEEVIVSLARHLAGPFVSPRTSH